MGCSRRTRGKEREKERNQEKEKEIISVGNNMKRRIRIVSVVGTKAMNVKAALNISSNQNKKDQWQAKQRDISSRVAESVPSQPKTLPNRTNKKRQDVSISDRLSVTLPFLPCWHALVLVLLFTFVRRHGRFVSENHRLSRPVRPWIHAGDSRGVPNNRR